MKFKIGDVVGIQDRKYIIVGTYNDGYDYKTDGSDEIWHVYTDALDLYGELLASKEIKQEDDNINHPKRYTKGKVECIDAVESATMDLTGIESFCTGNVIKYVWRWKDKEQIDSLKKAKWYLNHLIKHLENQKAVKK